MRDRCCEVAGLYPRLARASRAMPATSGDGPLEDGLTVHLRYFAEWNGNVVSARAPSLPTPRDDAVVVDICRADDAAPAPSPNR